MVLAIALAGFAFCLLLGWIFVDRPIREMIRLMEQAEQVDFLSRAAARSYGLVGRLGKSFNRMLERITTLNAFNMERLKELALISDFSQKIVATLDLNELLQNFDTLLGEKLGFREFALLTREEEKEEVVVQVARGFADTSKVRGMRFRADEGLTGHVFKTRQSYYLSDTRTEPRYLYYKGEKRDDGSFLSIPLLFKGEVVGILNFTRPGINSFTPHEIQFLNTIAVEVAIALVNARLYSRTRELAVRDDLTQLYNRRHFQSIFPLEIKRSQRFGQPVSLLMIDIDRFKKFNDTYGHIAGDERLKELGQLMHTKIREVDFVARWGGEEFVIILPNTSKKDALSVAEKLRLMMRSHPYASHPPTIEEPFTVSIGVAAFPDDGDSMVEVLSNADAALYQAKGTGRDRVVIFEKK